MTSKYYAGHWSDSILWQKAWSAVMKWLGHDPPRPPTTSQIWLGLYINYHDVNGGMITESHKLVSRLPKAQPVHA